MDKDILVQMLYLDMNSYFASVAQQVEPALRGKPVGIVTTLHKNAACIAASYDAKAKGIRVGTRMEEARALCPGIIFRSARHDVYVDVHAKIKAAVERVIPISGVHSVDEVSCRLTGSEQQLPNALAVAEAARQSIYQHAGVVLHCSIGLGPNRLLAKIAGELHKPSGTDWLTPAVLPGKLAHLKLTDLPGISTRMNARLEAAGVHDIPALYALPPKHARAIWRSVEGERFLRALRGEDIPDPITKPHSFGHSQVIAAESRSPERARLILRRLTVKAATRLRRAGFFATSLYISVKNERYKRHYYGGKITATQDSFTLLAHMEVFWQALAPKKLFSVSVMLGGLVSRENHIADLFEARAAGSLTPRERLCATVDTLNQRYGRDTVVFGEPPKGMTAYSGAKIAFGRIPLKIEFKE
ncbi:MAG TPA: hypothetical protein EYG79_12250 [Rhodobacteraceae bacterium]|nr:hypothetical protein [Paracoccaceae bacterium]